MRSEVVGGGAASRHRAVKKGRRGGGGERPEVGGDCSRRLKKRVARVVG
jgi:hypothetical protein